MAFVVSWLMNVVGALPFVSPMFGDNMVPVIEREFPLPDIVGKSVAAARMMKEGLLNLHRRGSRWLWRLQIWRCIRT